MGLVLVGLAGCIFGLAVGMLVSRFHGVYEVFRHVHGRLPTWRSEYVSSLSRDYEFRVLPFLLRVGMLGPYSQSLIDATRHPWLRDNGDALGRINAKEALCKPRSPLRANLPPIPDDLFKDIYIDNSKPWYLLGWHNTERVLKEILSCPKALQSCEQLSITVNRHDRHGFSGLEEASAPPANLPRLLADVLKQMPRVQNFSWSGALDNEEALGVFESAIGYSYMLLPSIKHLQVSPRAYFFAKFAPNLESVTAPDPNPRIPTPNWHVFTYDRAQYLLIDSARTSQNLKTFGMRAVWTPSLVGCVLGALPHIESLYLDGGFWKPLRLLSGVREEQSVGERIKDVLDVVKGFKSLTSLRLPPATDIGLENYFSECGNVYFGAHGNQILRMDFRREISDIDLLGRMVLDNLPHLDNLTIGRGMSKLEGQARDGKLVWPWTGRVRKYLLECFPRYQGRDGEEDEDPNGPLFDQPGQDEDNLPSSAYSLASFPSRELF